MDSKPNVFELPCRKARRIIAEQKSTGKDWFRLRMALHQVIEADENAFEDEQILSAVLHIRSCSSCQSWLNNLEPLFAARKARIEKYCCPEMFDSINEENSKIKFSFCLYRGQPCWRVNEDLTFAHYCPWCGKKLPLKSFE